MATLLLLVIYIAFIGLGIPDSLFGTAWPAIYTEFDLPISFASFVTVIISCSTIVSSMFSAKVINRFGTNKVSAFSTALTAAALLGFSVSGNLWLLCLFAVPLGLGAGAIDTALNNYVAVHYSATHMSFLHCFYGIGVSVSPYIMSLVIGGKSGWRGGYQVAFLIQLCIALILILRYQFGKRFTLKRSRNKILSKHYHKKKFLRYPASKPCAACFLQPVRLNAPAAAGEAHSLWNISIWRQTKPQRWLCSITSEWLLDGFCQEFSPHD